MNKSKLLIIISAATMFTGCSKNIDEKVALDVDIKDNDELVLDENTFEDVFETGKEDDKVIEKEEILILANKKNNLGDSYVPDNLTTLNLPASDGTGEHKLSEVAVESLEKMFSDAKSNGINLRVRSAYRSYNTQREVYASKVQKLGQTQADKFSAKPGASEHQTGLAIDIVSTEFGKLHTDFQYTETYKWLKENCANYGYILRYPRGKSDITGYNFEPWHYRYVGVSHAKEIMESGLTFEEYLQKLSYIEEI